LIFFRNCTRKSWHHSLLLNTPANGSRNRGLRSLQFCFCNDTRQRTLTPSSVSPSGESEGNGRRRDDGVWYDFSDAPLLLFYVYSAFVDHRTSATGLCNNLFWRLSCCCFADNFSVPGSTIYPLYRISRSTVRPILIEVYHTYRHTTPLCVCMYDKLRKK